MAVNPKIGQSELTGGSIDDVLLPSEIRAVDTRSVQYVYNPTTGLLEYQRTPTVFKGVTITSASGTGATIWTPTTGKRFRLMQFEFQLPLSTTLAAAGLLTMTLRDGTTSLPFVFLDYLPNVTPTNAIGDNHTIRVLQGNGYPSLAVNNTLNVVLSSALATGAVRWGAWGTEE